MHAALVERPGSRIRRLARDRAQEIQFTRFLRNEAVTSQEMFAEAAAQTAERAAGRDIVIVQDTSELALGGRRAKAAGYGPVGKGGGLRGVLLHAGLALDASTGAVLGLADGAIWNRSGGRRVTSRRLREMKDKESRRWIDTTARAAQTFTAAASLTVISDRESDIYEHFAHRPDNVHLIVRACQNRKMVAPEPAQDPEADEELLFPFIDGLPEMARYQMEIPSAPGRPARTATLTLRWSPVSLCRPRNATGGPLPDTVNLTVVDVCEVDAPEGAEPIHWRLLTTHAVENADQARRIIALYRMRWTIEEFFRTLKTAGYDIEAADIGDPKAMINLTAAVTVSAVTVMQLVRARDGDTEQLLVDAFEPEDQPLIEAVSQRLEGATARQKNPHAPGGLAYVAWVCARLGGWTGYYGKPGPVVMLKGMLRLRGMIDGWRLAREIQAGTSGAENGHGIETELENAMTRAQ